MGTYRYLLAMMVAASHCGIFIWGYNQGVVAVISFMLLSGYVMTLLIGNYYAAPARVPYFYLDRLARLLPQFWFYSLLVLLAMHLLGFKTRHLQWMDYGYCTTEQLWLNFSLFGNNFYRYFGPCMNIAPSWSLGLEAFFYLIIPWLILTPYLALRIVAGLAACAVGLAAMFGQLDSDLYGFRYIVGTLHIFLAGAAVARPDLFGRYTPHALWLLAVGLYAYAYSVDVNMYVRWQVKEVLVGIIIGIPALMLLSKYKFSKIDELLGNISYGMFLNHVLLRWCAEVYLGIHIWNASNFPTLITCASVASYLSYRLIELPALKARRKMRLDNKQFAHPAG